MTSRPRGLQGGNQDLKDNGTLKRESALDGKRTSRRNQNLEAKGLRGGNQDLESHAHLGEGIMTSMVEAPGGENQDLNSKDSSRRESGSRRQI